MRVNQWFSHFRRVFSSPLIGHKFESSEIINLSLEPGIWYVFLFCFEFFYSPFCLFCSFCLYTHNASFKHAHICHHTHTFLEFASYTLHFVNAFALLHQCQYLMLFDGQQQCILTLFHFLCYLLPFHSPFFSTISQPSGHLWMCTITITLERYICANVSDLSILHCFAGLVKKQTIQIIKPEGSH